MDANPLLQRKTAQFTLLVTEGTHYEVGRTLGAHHKNNSAMLSFLSSPSWEPPG